ncbi:unnamed protein product [Cylicocyclus nassatus]|uniref:Uncharacterized protein n=1 Tax=Cylicocyclus nassatus TaxID=53992 RepID=A0AA36GSA2_CYLNA|nr:unnamed protein product [Cylicocyclus nassatus]
MMKHVLRALGNVATLSLTFQKSDSLAVDAMEATRVASRSLIDTVINSLHHELMRSTSVLRLSNGRREKRLDKQFLLDYYKKSEHRMAARILTNALQRPQVERQGTFLRSVQRNGLNLLTVAPSKLAYQWIHPKPGLNAPAGVHSAKGSSTNMMSTIQEALSKKKLNASSLTNIMGTEAEVETLLNVFSEQAVKGPLRSESDIERVRQDIVAEERAKAQIFSIGTRYTAWQSHLRQCITMQKIELLLYIVILKSLAEDIPPPPRRQSE